jgi:hypothetical protein
VFRVDVGSENRSKLAGAATGNKIAHVELPGVLCRVMITYTEKSTNEAPRSDGEWARDTILVITDKLLDEIRATVQSADSDRFDRSRLDRRLVNGFGYRLVCCRNTRVVKLSSDPHTMRQVSTRADVERRNLAYSVDRSCVPMRITSTPSTAAISLSQITIEVNEELDMATKPAFTLTWLHPALVGFQS